MIQYKGKKDKYGGCTMKTKKRSNVILLILFFIIFLSTLIFGIVSICIHLLDKSQAILVIIEGVLGIICLFVPYLLEKVFHISTAFFVRLGWYLFVFSAASLGEACQLYYRLSWWDDFLHIFSSIGIAMIGFCIAENILKNSSGKKGIFLCLLFSTIFSFAIGFVWEFLEFCCDCIAGTNMQKFIPEIDSIFNGGNSFIPLNGTNEEIATFFREPTGYKYALNDTMSDIIDCIIGTTLFSIIAIIRKKLNKDAFSTLIVFKNKSITEN